MSENLVIVSREQILRRICDEYLEMPGLRLTSAQAQRLWGLDADTCTQLLQSLTEQHFLHRRNDGSYSLFRQSDGTYARVADGIDRVQGLRMAKAGHPPSHVPRRTGSARQ